MTKYKYELALLWGNGTWNTEIFNIPVPDNLTINQALDAYFTEVIAPKSGAILYAIYNDNPNAEEKSE